MKRRRRAVAGSVVMVCASAAVFVVPAQAQVEVPAGANRAAASSTALELTVFGETLTIGDIEVTSASALPSATARGLGLLVAGISQGESTAASAAEGESGGSADPICGALALPPTVPALSLDTACGTALTSILAGNPSAEASALVADLGISATELLGTLTELGIPLEAGVEDVAEQVLTNLGPLFDGLADAGLDAQSLITDLIDAITDGGDLLSIALGTAASSIETVGTADGGSVTAAAQAAGAVIEVLNRDALGLGLAPVLTIEIGAAGAQAVADRLTGVATPTVSPALVVITIAPDIATALGLPTNVIEVAPGQTIDLPLPAPLTSRITVADGVTETLPDGTARASAVGVGIELLTGLPGGGIVLGLAASSAEAQAVPAQVPPVTTTTTTAPPVVETPPTLPRTGGSGALGILPPAAALLAGLALLRLRRATA